MESRLEKFISGKPELLALKWMPVSGFDFVVCASSEGHLVSLAREKAVLLKSKIYGKKRYASVVLRQDGVLVTHLVHRLIAKTYHENPNNLPCVNHINGIRNDNRPSNLEWCTHSENRKHAFETGLATAKKGEDSPFSKKISQFTLDGVFVRDWPAAKQVQRETGMRQSGVSNAANGKTKTAYGYIWRYSQTA